MSLPLPYLKDSEYNFYIPVELCKHCLAEKFTAPLRLYVYLKGLCSGKIRITRTEVKKYATDLKCDPKSIKNNLRKLIKANWVGYNEVSGYYFVRGFDQISRMNDFRSRTGAEFQKSYLKNFKAFIAGSFIGYLANFLRRKRAAERYKRGSNQTARNFDFFPVSTSLIAKLLSVSISTAHQMKRAAIDAGFIEITKGFTNTGYQYFEKEFYKKANPKISGRVREKKGALVLIDTDRIKSLIRFKKREKNRRINKRVREKYFYEQRFKEN